MKFGNFPDITKDDVFLTNKTRRNTWVAIHDFHIVLERDENNILNSRYKIGANTEVWKRKLMLRNEDPQIPNTRPLSINTARRV
jgi:hypothetical protein